MKKFLLILLSLGLFIACPKKVSQPIEEPKEELRPVPIEYQDTIRIKDRLFIRYRTVKGDNLWNISKNYLSWVNNEKPNNSQIFYYWLQLLPKDFNQYTDFLPVGKIVYLPYLTPKQPTVSQPTISKPEEIQHSIKKVKDKGAFYHYPLWFQIALVVFIIGSAIIVMWIIVQDLRQ